MTPDTLQIAMLRRLTAEPTAEMFSDADLAAALERRPLDDGRGGCAGGGFDLYAAAADLWEQKAAVLAQDYDFAADGADYQRSQAHEHALNMARLFRARREPRSIFQPADMGRRGARLGEAGPCAL